MTPDRIKDWTHALGQPADWDEERQGPCGCLHARFVRDPDLGPEWGSVWRPTPEELVGLMNGGVVMLTVCGLEHPPVSISVVGAEHVQP